MKKINLLIVMALATQGSSLAAKGKLDDGYQSDIDGANIRNKRKDIDGANIRNKRKSNSPLLKKYAEDNSAKDAAPQIAHIIETADSEMENAPKFRLTGIMSRLWQNKAVRIVVLAAAVSGTVYLLAHYGISQETADQMRDFVKTLPQVTQDQLKSLGNSMSSSGSTVVNFITDAIGNTASALSHYGNASVEAARGLAYGLKDTANAAVGNTAKALSSYAIKAGVDAVMNHGPDAVKAGGEFIMGRLSNLKNWWSGERNPQLEEEEAELERAREEQLEEEEAELERRREELFRNQLH